MIKMILKPFAWLRNLVYEIRHGERDLDTVYPDRHHATAEQAMTNGMIAGNLPGGMGTGL